MSALGERHVLGFNYNDLWRRLSINLVQRTHCLIHCFLVFCTSSCQLLGPDSSSTWELSFRSDTVSSVQCRAWTGQYSLCILQEVVGPPLSPLYLVLCTQLSSFPAILPRSSVLISLIAGPMLVAGVATHLTSTTIPPTLFRQIEAPSIPNASIADF